MYFSTCIVWFAFLWFCCGVLFGSGSLDVKSETVFIYILMFSVHVVIKFQGGYPGVPPPYKTLHVVRKLLLYECVQS